MTLTLARMMSTDGRVHAFREFGDLWRKSVRREATPLCGLPVREAGEVLPHDVPHVCGTCESKAKTVMPRGDRS